MTTLSHKHRGGLAILSVAVVFSTWAGALIYRSSAVASDERRYFLLFDDAMISMRYAWNLAHGLGLVWNAGERVEGYTNLLQVLLMAIPAWLFDKSGAALAVQLMGLAMLLAAGTLAGHLAAELLPDSRAHQRKAVSIITMAATLAYYPLVFWSIMGMETGLVTCLILGSLAVAWRPSLHIRHGILLGILLGLAFIARNDSVVLALPIWGYVAWATWGRRERWPVMAAAIAVCAALMAAQLVFRWNYYGAILPNTYTLKMSDWPAAARAINGVGFIAPYIRTHALILLGTAVCLYLLRSRKVLSVASIVLASLVYQVYVGGDPWPYWRMLAPATPLAIALCVLAAIHSRPWSRPLLVGALAAFVSVSFATWPFWNEMNLTSKPYTADANASMINRALAIKTLTTPDAVLGVFWAGTIPYYTDRPAIDFLGKMDLHVALLAPDQTGQVAWHGMTSVPGHNKYDLAYSIQTLRPTHVEGFQWGSQDLSAWGADHYTAVTIGSETHYLLTGSPHVIWPATAVVPCESD